jgi:homoserine O-acetyltransferase
MTTRRLALACALLFAAGPVSAQQAPATPDLIVQKQTFEMPSYTTLGGRTIRNVRVGYQTAGTLNADRSNAILITHFFSGNSHAFGRFAAGGPAGYWDAIIGPGKAIDTNRWFVVASDTLVNLNTDPNTTTTGPASVNPETGRPWGMDFPVVQIGDFVNVQKALVESLGIRRLHAVMGASMGALQAYDWAARHPEMVTRIVPVIAGAEADGFLIGWLDLWAQPIRLDPNWNNGDYYGREPPNRGLATSLALVTMHALHADFVNQTFGRQPADAARDPAAALDNRFRVQQFLADAGAARARVSDANHFLYLVKANQLFVAGGGAAPESLARIKAPTLMLYAPTDMVFLESAVERTRAAIAAGGARVEAHPIAGPRGHLNGIAHIAPLGPRIAEFLAR